jgi:multiple sugar transport system substrate-binding protein
MNRRQVVGVAIAVGSALVLSTACGSSGGGTDTSNIDFSGTAKGTLHAWAFDNPDDVGKARLADAKKFLSGVDIQMDETSFDAQKFTTRLAGGDVPDVVQMDRQYVATYAAQGLILPLDKCYSQNDVDPKQRFYPSVLGDVTYKDQVWAVPQFFQPPAILLNRNVMDAAGVTPDQIDTSNPDVLIDAIKKMYKTSGGNPSVMGFNPVPTGEPNMWVLGLGGQLIDKDGKPTLDNPNNEYPLELLKKITDAQGGWAKDKSFTDTFDVFGGKNQFVKNQVGSELDYQWYPNVLAAYKDQLNLDAVPFKDKDGNPVSVAGGSSFVIPAKSKNPAAACQWALRLTAMDNWLAAGAARADTLKESGGTNTGLFTGSPDADKKLRDMYVHPDSAGGFDKVINTFYDVVGVGKSFGASPAGQTIQTELINAITETLLGQKSAKDALAAAQAKAMTSYNSVTR